MGGKLRQVDRRGRPAAGGRRCAAGRAGHPASFPVPDLFLSPHAEFESTSSVSGTKGRLAECGRSLVRRSTAATGQGKSGECAAATGRLGGGGWATRGERLTWSPRNPPIRPRKGECANLGTIFAAGRTGDRYEIGTSRTVLDAAQPKPYGCISAVMFAA
ncbi:hypothetical protein GCM10009610_06790 [Pseudonocardia xinjiangensis]